ncbi:MAG: glycosyltransferase [Actinomycetia bacterium]|nr:glycosyltransferase [Actinomycetes bacterium]
MTPAAASEALSMRIFYASGKRPNEALTDSTIWHENLFGSLVSLGHDVVEFDYDLEPLLAHADFTVPENASFIAEHRPTAERALLDQLFRAHSEKPVDLLFTYFYSSCASAATIRQISEAGIPTMNWYCNASYQLHLVADLAPAYDYSLVPEKFRLEDYRALGANPVYCQEAANPDVYHSYDVPVEYDVTFVGARYADRPDYIKALLAAGIEARVWGPGWTDPAGLEIAGSWTDFAAILPHPHAWRSLAGRVYRRAFRPQDVPTLLPRRVCGAPLSDEEMVKMYSRSKISLGFSGVAGTLEDGRRITQLRLRDFEAPMAGAFYLCEYMDELDEFFEIGKEIVCYETVDEMVALCRYYLAHDDEREAIREAGRLRSLRDHTWQRRLSDVFSAVGLQ